jgi:pimeloyl-ACP methyl ester carboxylesterase
MRPRLLQEHINEQGGAAHQAPPLRYLGLEPLRAALEFAGLQLMPERDFPPGDGHPVVVFPGLASDSHATVPLRRFCEKLGYEVHDWGRGFNVGPPPDFRPWVQELAEEIAELISANGRRASFIGWSLGGLYAREVAKLLRPRVRRVITIGTPLGGDPSHTHAGLVYRLLNGRPPPVDARLNARLRTAPAVPTTSIYSRSDGAGRTTWRSRAAIAAWVGTRRCWRSWQSGWRGEW